MKTTLADLAESILNPEVVKTASVTHTSRSEIGGALSKIAAELRNHKSDEVSYQDLTEFRKTYGV